MVIAPSCLANMLKMIIGRPTVLNPVVMPKDRPVAEYTIGGDYIRPFCSRLPGKALSVASRLGEGDVPIYISLFEHSITRMKNGLWAPR